MARYRTLTPLALATIAGVSTALMTGPTSDAAESKAIGLQVITFRPADYTGSEQDCTEVVTAITQYFLDHYAKPAERERLSRAENGTELSILVNNAPGKSDICNAPEAYLAERPMHRSLPLIGSKVSYGMNLDGTEDGHETAKTCSHKKFTGLNGEPGVDNQLYRALGCFLGYRYEPRGQEDKVRSPFDYDAASKGTKEFAVGEQNYLIQITPKEGAADGEVDVDVTNGRNSVVMGGNGKPIGWTTQTVDPDPQFHQHVKGKLVGGHLTTEPFDFLLKRHYQAMRGVYSIRDARFDLEIKPDGSARGVLAGYFPIQDLYWFIPAGYGRLVTASSSLECAAMYKTMFEQADGYPDPETGQCTALSGAMAMELVPAFIVSSEAATQLSSTETPSLPQGK